MCVKLRKKISKVVDITRARHLWRQLWHNLAKIVAAFSRLLFLRILLVLMLL